MSAGVWPFRSLTRTTALKPVRGLAISILAHVAALALITHLDFSANVQTPSNTEISDRAPIYIDLQALKNLKILRTLPVVLPPGPGGQPGSAEKPATIVFQASSAKHPKFTIVLKPLRADNNRQAINQKLSPPELKLQLEQKLPDIVLAGNPAAARPHIDTKLRQPLVPKPHKQNVDAPEIASSLQSSAFESDRAAVARPQPNLALQHPLAAPGVQNPNVEAPEIASNAPGSPFKADHPGVARPRPDLTLHGPLAVQGVQNRDVDAPTIAGSGPALTMRISPSVNQPQLPVSYLSSAMQAPRAHGSANGKGADGGGANGGGRIGTAGSADRGTSNGSGDSSGGIVVVSLDPAEFSRLASLAQGNRYGQLAIAPSIEGSGSSGGSPNGAPGGGWGGPGRGGDGSIGIGPGHSGAGGGGPEGPTDATFSALGGAGRSGGVDATRLLAPILPSTVYAVPMPPARLRRAPLVVATGPIGGGGLDAYGALSCGKVYTIFLPMPGKSWVLQYCAHADAEAKAAPQASGVIQMEAGLVPPTVDQEYDFRRMPIPDRDADKMIVLRGIIDKDGSISDVNIYRGVLPEMDSQAAIALRNWKFRPATRAGLPVGVDVLVGIPARLPEKLNAGTSGAPGAQN